MRRALIGRIVRAWRWATASAFVIGLLSRAWFIVRTGMKPSRAAWLATYILPLLSITGFVGKNRSWRRKLLTAVAVLLIAGGASWIGSSPGSLNAAPLDREVDLVLEENRATTSPASDLFIAPGTHGDDEGYRNSSH